MSIRQSFSAHNAEQFSLRTRGFFIDNLFTRNKPDRVTDRGHNALAEGSLATRHEACARSTKYSVHFVRQGGLATEGGVIRHLDFTEKGEQPPSMLCVREQVGICSCFYRWKGIKEPMTKRKKIVSERHASYGGKIPSNSHQGEKKFCLVSTCERKHRQKLCAKSHRIAQTVDGSPKATLCGCPFFVQ